MSRAAWASALGALILAFTGCSEGVEDHPPLVVLVDRLELIRAGTADDPLAHLRRHGRRVEAPRYEGWFHDVTELYFQSRHGLRLGSDDPDVDATIRAMPARVWMSVYTSAERDQARRVEQVAPTRDELQRYHTEFVESNDFPGWPDEPDEVEVAGAAMQAWARAYPRLIEQVQPRTVLVIAWEGVASSRRVGELAG